MSQACPRGVYIHKGKHESLDHILVSEQFYDYSEKRQWSFRELRVVNDHLDELETKAAKRLQSDHGAVAAAFEFDPQGDA
jgi:hypothetical protein